MAKCDINNKQRLFDVLKSKDIVDMANDNNIEYRATLSGNILNVSVKSGVDNAYIVQSLIENAVNNSFPGILLSSRIEDGYINTILFTERVNNTIKDKRNKRIAKLRFDRSIVRNDGEVISPSGYPAIPMANDRNGIIKNLEKQIHQEATNAWDLGEVADVSNRGVGKLINEYYKSDVVSYYDEGTDLTFARVQVPEFLVDIYYNELLNIIKERKEKWSSDLMEQSSFWDENGGVDQYNSISTTNTNIGSKAQYSQYLNSLNRPNTNPILQNNQQEQIKKFSELQERLSNKEFTEAAKNVFENSTELQEAVYEALGFETELPSYDNIIETDNKKDKKERIVQRRELVLREINAIEQLIKTNPDEITIYYSKPYKDAYEVIKYFDKNNWEKDDSKYKESKIITKPSYLHNHLEEELQKRIKNLQIINSSLFDDVEKINYSNIFKEGKSYSSLEVLKYISDNRKDVLSGIAKTLIKYAEKNNVEIQIVKEAPKKIAGAYFYNNKIEVYGSKNVTSHTLIHEIIHSFSSDYIKNNPKSLPVLQLENILKNILDKKILKEYSNFEGSYEDYATKNIHELLSEIISRPDILSHLALYDINYNLIKDIYKKETLLDKIIKALSDIFNFSKNEIETLSDLILFNARDIFEASSLWSEFNRTSITPQQKQQALDVYTDYIARVSVGIIKNPSSGDYNYTSQVKDIVYHGTLPQNKFEKFDKQKGTNLSGEYGGIHFGDLTAAIERPTKIVKAESFLAGIEEDLSNFKPNIIPVILNIENIKRVEEGKNWGQGDWSKLISKESEADGYVYTNKIENKGKDSYVVFEPEQIHILSSKADIQGFKDFTQGKQFQKLTAEEKAKTVEQVTKEHRSIAALKDLAHKLAHRIGGKVEFVNDTSLDYKGYNQGNTSVINLAYATSETNLHEILAHPIIRAIKSNKHLLSILDYSVLDDNGFFVQKAGKTIAKFPTREQAQKYINENSKDSELYQSLLKELETSETGRKVFEQVKRDYKYKITAELITDRFGRYGIKEGNSEEFTFDTKEEAEEQVRKINSKEYTLEEQQEEAIVTLLGMMAADKLDAKKDATLISKLKELWKQISDFVKSLLTGNISENEISNIIENEVTYTDEENKPCAKDGIRSSKFTKGSQWEIVKDLKGYPSHAQGGVDIKLGKDGFSFTGKDGEIKAANGLVLPKIK